eukprot:10276440-Lingulodinium_polyedra.AAC.1
MLRRPVLSVLSALYDGCAAGEPAVPLTAEMRAELDIAAGLVPFCRVNLGREASPRIYCSDASQFGYALATAAADVTE